MKNIKTIFILVLSLILLFAVSCDTESKTGVKNNPPENDTEITDGETESGGTRTLSYYAGNWYGNLAGDDNQEHLLVTINSDGSVIIIADSGKTVPSTSITKNSDTSYTYHDAEMNQNTHFNFTSDTKGTITLEDVGSGNRMDHPVTKK